MTDQHFKPHPKGTTKRKRQNRDAWQVLRERVLRLDKVCVVCTVRPSEGVHHVVPKDFSGDDLAVNLIGVCGSGTTRCHGLIEARDPFACNRVRQVLEYKPGILQYVLDTVGQAWLDDRYPLDAGLAAVESGVERGDAVENGGKVEAAPTPRSNFFGVPIPRWMDKAELDEAFADWLEISRAMAAAGEMPLAKKGGGESAHSLLLGLHDLRDRYREYLPKGEAA